jgi:hypothetical protein
MSTSKIDFVTIVSYDYDYGWICEELSQCGEFEITSEWIPNDRDDEDEEFEHTEDGRRAAFNYGRKIASERKGKCLHHYEYPEIVKEKRQAYKQLQLEHKN